MPVKRRLTELNGLQINANLRCTPGLGTPDTYILEAGFLKKKLIQ